jgi:hypothetical protein
VRMSPSGPTARTVRMIFWLTTIFSVVEPVFRSPSWSVPRRTPPCARSRARRAVVRPLVQPSHRVSHSRARAPHGPSREAMVVSWRGRVRVVRAGDSTGDFSTAATSSSSVYSTLMKRLGFSVETRLADRDCHAVGELMHAVGRCSGIGPVADL